MIEICIIVIAIGFFACALLKAKMDDWLGDSSMNGKSRLSLKRNRCHNAMISCDMAQGTGNDPIEISDDESFNLPPNIQESTSVTSPGAMSVLNNMTDDTIKSDPKRDILVDQLISNDLTSDEDSIVLDDVSAKEVSNKSLSMFSWDKPLFVTNPFYQDVFPGSSVSHCSREVTSTEAPNKRPKLGDQNSFYSTSSDSSFEYHDDDDDDDDDEINMDFLDREESPPEVGIQHEIMIAGTKVRFPVKPYPCQIAVMNKLILGCTKEQHCLLESPTGSGKTLALLCGALAWQEQYSEKIKREQSDEMDAESSHCDDGAVNNFFLSSSRYFDAESPDKVANNEKYKNKRVPKIYYGTRTHKQIEQVIREFKKTAYRYKRMTILSSRKHTCIQKTKKNKDELCKELLAPLNKIKKCGFYNEYSKNKERVFSYMRSPWDIEDLVSVGKRIKTCPYFSARALMDNAEIIFCPYNYVLNPDIRERMQINLRNSIVILDEAHNVESICRDAASVDIKDNDLTSIANECHQLFLDEDPNHIIYATIRDYLKDLVKFLQEIVVKNTDSSDEKNSMHWLGVEFRVLLDVHDVGCPRFPAFLNACEMAIEHFKKNMKEERFEILSPTISQDAKTILEHLCFAMQMIKSDKFVNDYRIYVVETIESTGFSSKSVRKTTTVRTMKLICMNPAVVFAPLARDARSVILTSGTLTPITSFQSELGTQFPHIVNPDHIIPKEQVYVRYITHGPKKKPLIAKHETVNTWNFQEELGELILQVCDAVPYGVLCFFSSYKVMHTILDRWKQNDTWNRLSDLKKIFVEPRDNRMLPEIMKEYHSVIKESSSKESSYYTADGAILFAVFRGKVAEGIDFSDNEARCVLAIGIPYLCNKGNVKMKMEYNDVNKSKSNLLSGREWYTVDAFRALNQAIGRCVRHKNDWGAVLLVDQRFQDQKNINYLPKWIKTNMKSKMKYDLEIELQDFVVMQVAREKGEKEDREAFLEDAIKSGR